MGNLVYMVDQKGKVTEHTYDLCNRRIETIDAMNRITSFRYDPNGNLVGVTDPNGNETITYYDSSNRKIAVQDALGKTTTFDYDENGNQIAQTDPLGRVVRLEYNENDQVKKLKDPPGYFTGDSFTEKIYDDLGRIQEFKDQALHRTLTNYNRLNQKREVREAYGSGDVALTLYDYDQNGNLKNITNAKSAHFQFRYNALNQLTKTFDDCPIADDPTGPSVQFDYDKNGNLKNETRRDGSTVITRIYDDLNRLVEVRRGGEQGELLQSFGYDDLSRMTQAVDYNEGKGTHTVQFEYDELHRVKAEVQDGRRVEKDFDPNGNPVRLRYPSGKALEREYDALNRMTQIEDGQGGIATFEYWEDGQPKTVAYANGITLSLTYNQVGLERIREYVNAASLYNQTTDVYSKDRNVTQELEAKVGSSSITRDYTYDSQDRIKTENKTGSGQIGSWTYDAVGNWIRTTQNGPTEDRTVNNDNEYTSISGLTPLVYDVHGNLSTSGTSTYVYDWKNRPTEVWDGSTKVAEYTYDALNRRVSKTTQAISVVTTYYYDNAQVIEEHEQAVFKRAYVYGEYVDDPLMMENDQGQDYYYLKDRQYGIRSIADSNGNEVERYEYTAFGRRTVYRNDGGSWVAAEESQIGNTYGYTGRQWDKESGLWYYRNRMYSPTLGRFLQRDPSGYVDGVNLYAYVKNNPLVYLDPHGLTTQTSSNFNSNAPSATPIVVEPSRLSSFVDYVNAGAYSSQTSQAISQALDSSRPVVDRFVQGTLGLLSAPVAAAETVLRLALNPVFEAAEVPDRYLTQRTGLPWEQRQVICQSFGGPSFVLDDVANLGIGLLGATGRAGRTLLSAEKLFEKATTVGELRAQGLKDAHHVIQDAAVRDIPGYNTLLAPGIQLPGPATRAGTPHSLATQVQREAGGGTYGAERKIGYEALRRAGIAKNDARAIIEETDAYFESLGITRSTPTRVPGNR